MGIVESRCLLWGREYVWPEQALAHRCPSNLLPPPAPTSLPGQALAAMAPHFTLKELDSMVAWTAASMEPIAIHKRLCAQRKRLKVDPPDLTTVRRAIKGATHKRGGVERRGRRRKLNLRALKKLNSKRLALYKEVKGEREVGWQEVIRKSRVTKVHPSTASRRLQDAGYDVKWRPPRMKPMRDKEIEKERLDVCDRWRKKPKTYFSEQLDLIMDNKFFAIPTYAKAKRFAKMRKARGHLRTRAEGLQEGFTKPNVKRHRQNPGCSVNVCAAIIGCRIRVWKYLPQKWNGEVAADLYRGTILRALKRHRGQKRSYAIAEDNDRAGYKALAAKAAKKEVKIRPIQFPRYSPDLNPLDFFVWHEIERKMEAGPSRGGETVKEYKARLRRVAMGLPEDVIRKAVESMKSRAQAIYDVKGKDIARD